MMNEEAETRPEEESDNTEEATETHAESRPVDVGGQNRGIGSEGRPTYPSEMLYIVREANIVEELDEVLASKGVELKEEQDG
jgi:hypothetical protein